MAIEKDVQKRILRAIFINGWSATTREISDLSGLSIMSARGGLRHLYSRALISRKPEIIKAKMGVPPHKKYTWKLNNKLIPKIKRLISEIGVENVR